MMKWELMDGSELGVRRPGFKSHFLAVTTPEPLWASQASAVNANSHPPDQTELLVGSQRMMCLKCSVSSCAQFLLRSGDRGMWSP